ISDLVINKYLDEERFTRAFIRGKFRMNNWGKIKIKIALKQKHINEKLINYCFDEIDDDEYHRVLYSLLEKKNRELRSNNKTDKTQKLKSYAYSRGFEYELINEIISELDNSTK
ncbi:MAG: regulatory protein RecX, partial [Saprospiraceae bacterium]